MQDLIASLTNDCYGLVQNVNSGLVTVFCKAPEIVIKKAYFQNLTEALAQIGFKFHRKHGHFMIYLRDGFSDLDMEPMQFFMKEIQLDG